MNDYEMAPGFDADGGYAVGGLQVPDPWLALERDSIERRAWALEVSTASRTKLRDWPFVESVQRAVAAGSDPLGPGIAGHTIRGGFHVETGDGSRANRLLIRDPKSGRLVVGYDPSDSLDVSGLPRLVFWAEPSRSGQFLAIGVCSDGNELAEIEILDVTSGRLIDHPPLPPVHSSANRVQWLLDSDVLMFVGLEGDTANFDNQVFTYHLPESRVVRHEVPWSGEHNFRAIHVSEDGLNVVASEGLSAPVPVAIGQVSNGVPWRWKRFLRQTGDATFGRLTSSGYVGITYTGCDRGRVVRISTDDSHCSDPSIWTELVAESELVLLSLAVVGKHLFLHGRGPNGSLVTEYDEDGRLLRQVDLPFEGMLDTGNTALYAMEGAAGGGFRAKLSNLTRSAAVVSIATDADGAEVAIPSGVHFPELEIIHDKVLAPSGYEIAVTRLRLAGLKTVPHPTLIWAYGGFNSLTAPQYDPAFAVFARSGGEVVYAHISGDGSTGKAAWQRGRLEAKQRCYDDIYLVAEHLIRSGDTSTRQLALGGISNGGLMSAVCALQRPDLWRAVVSLAGWVDPIGSRRFPFVDLCARMELGDLDEPKVVERLLKISPLHLVAKDVNYPAMYLDAGDADTRVPPWMPMKLVAELQRTTTGKVLFRLWQSAGHGLFDDPKLATERKSEWLAFVMAELGVIPSAWDPNVVALSGENHA